MKVELVAEQDWRLWRDVEAAAADSDDARTIDGALHPKQRKEADWRALIRSAAASFIVRRDKGMTLAALRAVSAEAGHIELSLMVHPDERRSILIERLLEHALQWAALIPTAKHISLTIPVTNSWLAATAERAGFTIDEQLDRSTARWTRRVRQGVRIGLHSGQQYVSFETMSSLWRRAEHEGFDWISIFDHYRPPIDGENGPCFDGPTTLAALASETNHVRCALMVSTPTWRHPAIAANIASTVDHISGGRVEFGFGVGGPDNAFRQYGIDEASLADRFEQLDEACRVVRLLWNGGPADFAGKHFQLSRAWLQPAPLQQRIPIIIGGAGEKKTLPIAATYADVWNCAVLPLPEYTRRRNILQEHCERLGRDPTGIRQSLTFRALIAESQTDVAEAETQLQAMQGGRRADLTEFISFGNAQQCLDKLAPYVIDGGVRDLLLGLRPPIDERTMELFAREVIPQLRRLVPTSD